MWFCLLVINTYAKSGREEPPNVRGQGQKPGGPHAWRAAAKRSYPMSEVRGSGREYQTDSAGTAETSYPTSEVGGGGREEIPRVWGQGRLPEELPHVGRQGRPAGGATPRPHAPTHEARGGGQEEQPHVQGAVAARAKEGLEELSHVEVQEGWRWEDTPRPR